MDKQELYLVFGGTLTDTRTNVLAVPAAVDLVGVYPAYAEALAAWRRKSHSSVDDAYVRYFIAPLHQLLSPAAAPDESSAA